MRDKKKAPTASIHASRVTTSLKAYSVAARNRSKPVKAFQIKHGYDDRANVFDQLVHSIDGRKMAKQASKNSVIKTMVDNRYKILQYTKYRRLKETINAEIQNEALEDKYNSSALLN